MAGYYGEELYSVGSASTEVKAGKTSNVQIQMTVVWSDSAGIPSSGSSAISISIGFAGGTDPAKGFDDMLPSTLDLSYELYLINNKTPSQKELIAVDPATGKATEQVSPGSYSIEAVAKVNGWDYAENDPVSFNLVAGETKDVPVTMKRLSNAIVLDKQKGDILDFGSALLSYGAQTPKAIDVWSFGSNTSSMLTVTSNPSKFAVSTSTLTGLVQDGPGVPFTIEPIIGLPVDTHTDTVEIIDGSTVLASFDVSFTVTPGPIYTVTFNSYGGSSISPIPVPHGTTITAPTPPTSDYGTFDTWYSDSGRTVPYVFSTPVTGNITLYAKWIATYNVGDTGPGGGTIFYAAEQGFTFYETLIDSGVTCYYLEVAPTDAAPAGIAWANTGTTAATTNLGTSSSIGSGRRNTLLILDGDPNAPAAKACVDYVSGGKNDWFLPSSTEFSWLWNSGVAGTFPNYWTSDENSDNATQAKLMYAYNAYLNQFKTLSQSVSSPYTPYTVRAIRAF